MVEALGEPFNAVVPVVDDVSVDHAVLDNAVLVDVVNIELVSTVPFSTRNGPRHWRCYSETPRPELLRHIPPPYTGSLCNKRRKVHRYHCM